MKRILSFLLSAVMTLSVITPTLTADIFATANDPAIDTSAGQTGSVEGESYLVSEVHANPLFRSYAQDIYTSESITYVPPTYFASSTLMSEAEAKQYILEQIKARNTSFSVSMRTQTYYDGYLIALALSAMEHNGVSTEGDYLLWQFEQIACEGNYSYVGGGYNISVTYTIDYFTTVQQEAEVDAAVSELLASFDFSSCSDYEKVYAIYKWICDNVEYDYYSGGTIKHSAYAAIINGKAVCQGYAVLFYRLMLELGIDCRVITGTSEGQNHAWNIVKLGDVYYNVDATWDAGYVYYDYFLRSDDNFSGHTRDEEFSTAGFYSRYPMATSDCVAPEWVIVNGVLLQYNGQDTDVVIPDGVIGISDYVFYGKNITSVVIPEGVQYISVEAFSDCKNLTTVSLPSTLQLILYGAFSFSGITEIVLPENLLLVDEMAFFMCLGMESITFLSPDTLISDSSGTIPTNATIIGYTGSSAQVYADKFSREFIDLNDKCEGNHTFGDYESLSDTYHIRYCIADNGCAVFEIAEHTYDHTHDEECNDCGYIREVDYSTIDSGNCGNNLTWHLSSEGVLTISGVGKMTEKPWSKYADQILSIVIEPGVTTTIYHAFRDCVNLTSVSLPEGLTLIDSYTFSGCTSLEEITVPNGCSISNRAFENCSSLKTVNLPDDLTKLEGALFENCTSLETIIIPAGVTEISSYLFAGCTSLKDVVLHDGITSIKYNAFDGCSSLEYIDIPDSVTSIGSDAFRKCTSLKTIIIPEGITKISDAMFSNCSALETVVIPSSVTQIGRAAFAYCTSLTEIDIPESVNTIGSEAFSGCEGIKTVVIPDGVTEIDTYTFSGCTSLEKVVLPNSVSKIDMYAFTRCTSLRDINLHDGIAEIWNSAFANTGLRSLTITGTAVLYNHVFADCINLEEVIFLDGVEGIPYGGFASCTSLTSITIPESIKSIGDFAFSVCSDLETVIVLSKDAKFGTRSCLPTTTTIYGYEGSTAQAYAETNGNEFVIICEGNHVFGNWVDHNSTQHKGECLNAFCDGGAGYADHVYDDSLDTDCNDCGRIRIVILASGETDEGAVWTVKSDGTMSISGSGELSVQDAEAWSEYSSGITSVTVSGITSIEDGIFTGFTSLESITIKSADIIIPDSETALPAGATVYGYAGSTVESYAEKYGRTFVEIPPVMPGDVNGDDSVDKNDAIYLLYSVLFGDTTYPLNQTCDFNGDGATDKNDAIYLLYHALFGAESYPLN